ncbi:MAG: hypothetical protein NT055_03830, partial [Nitrospirae bacterium]|nr:hypothetical protein [Nitrospirota bacterium]
DSFGRRIEKNVNGTITKYVYDNEDIITEYDGNNQLIASYTHGTGIDEPISMTNGQTYYYHTDALGSIIAITDSNRNVVQRYEYDSFGNIISVLNPNFVQPYTYTAREYDSETGLYFYRARYYDAEVGRFISEDSIGFRGGDVNFYAYTANNPVNRKDPKGLNWYGNWCGPGGSGPATDCYDSACKRHDKCYEDCGINWLSRWSLGNIVGSCAMACDEELLKGWKKCACSYGVGGW